MGMRLMKEDSEGKDKRNWRCHAFSPSLLREQLYIQGFTMELLLLVYICFPSQNLCSPVLPEMAGEKYTKMTVPLKNPVHACASFIYSKHRKTTNVCAILSSHKKVCHFVSRLDRFSVYVA